MYDDCSQEGGRREQRRSAKVTERHLRGRCRVEKLVAESAGLGGWMTWVVGGRVTGHCYTDRQLARCAAPGARVPPPHRSTACCSQLQLELVVRPRTPGGRLVEHVEH